MIVEKRMLIEYDKIYAFILFSLEHRGLEHENEL